MSTTQLPPPMALVKSIPPVIAALFGAMGFGGGVYNLREPFEGARMFGLIAPAEKADVSSTPESRAWQKAYVGVHGIRNIGNALSMLGLLTLWHYAPTPEAANAIKRCLGCCLIAGTTVALGDGYLLTRFSKEKGVSKEAADLSAKVGKQHTFIAFPILALGISFFYI